MPDLEVYLPGTDPKTVAATTNTAGARIGSLFGVGAIPTTTRVAVDHPNLGIVINGGGTLTVRMAPEESEETGLAVRWVQIDRPGVQPILEFGGRPLRQLAFTIVLGVADRNESVEPERAELRRIAASKDQVSLTGFGRPLDVDYWHVTDMTMKPSARAAGTNDVTRCDVTLTLTEVSDATINTGPLTGGSAVSAYLAKQTQLRNAAYAGRLVDASIKHIGGWFFPGVDTPGAPTSTGVSVNGSMAGESARNGRTTPKGATAPVGGQPSTGANRTVTIREGESIADALARAGEIMPDWRVAADYNGIKTPRPPAGTVIRIPPKTQNNKSGGGGGSW